MRDERQLARIHRVRTVQLTLSRAEEAAAQDKLRAEHALAERIATLAAAVAPVPVETGGIALGAEAHFRARLHGSALAADERTRAAGVRADRAAEAARVAKQDQTAAEKLLARAAAEQSLKAMRALEEAPAARKRHDPCG